MMVPIEDSLGDITLRWTSYIINHGTAYSKGLFNTSKKWMIKRPTHIRGQKYIFIYILNIFLTTHIL